MWSFSSRWLFSLFTACLLSVLSIVPASAEEGRYGHLVSASWLQENLADVVLLDASFAHLYKAGHIPGAVSADNYGGQEPSRAVMEGRFQSWGISPGRKIVVYDKGGDWNATRLFHDLYYYGIPAEDIFILDGGLSKWQSLGGAISKETSPAPIRGTFLINKVREDVRVRLPEFMVASGDNVGNALVDALGVEYYYGEEKFFTRAGHVPNAILMPSTEFFNADKTFKSPEEIRNMATYLGIQPGQTVHSHCGGGGAASVPWFALQFIADYPNVKLYWESHREWLRDERGLPFWTYSAPQLQRDSDWLDGWNAPMLRAFGVAKLNIVDVRSAEKYALGHVPFSLNVPADIFRHHLNRPLDLAGLLGSAGVNSDHEVVIVSDAGLTTSAALAFLAFEQLGHKRVSVLMGAIDEWGSRGHKLATVPTLVGMMKTPRDIAVPIATYVAKPRADVLIGNTKGAAGAQPRIFVSSGKAPSTRTFDGRTTHLPYPELLNADGTPKTAKELWKLISKAGVPRYAELILYAEDLAEAAVSYYVFRLMGWPDVKVLAK